MERGSTPDGRGAPRPDDAGQPTPRLLEAVRVLSRHGVRYVLIGGYAAVARGSPLLTGDVDICHARDRQNLERLAAALQDLGATLRGAPNGVPFRLDAKSLRAGDHFTFLTRAGALDCLGTPLGTSGYADLVAGSSELELAGNRVAVASVDDLIRMKRAAACPKDRIALEWLSALREEIRGDWDAQAGPEPGNIQ